MTGVAQVLATVTLIISTIGGAYAFGQMIGDLVHWTRSRRAKARRS